MEPQKPVRGKTKRVYRSAMAEVEKTASRKRAAKKVKSFQLIPKDVPNPNRRGMYRTLIEEFLGSGEEAVLVIVPDAKPESVVQQLYKTVQRNNYPVVVSRRIDIVENKRELQVFLSRKHIKE